MKKLIAVAAALFLLTGCLGKLVSEAKAWSLPEAHTQANKTLVNVGEWCSGTIIADNKVVTAAHCLPDVRQDSSRRPEKGQPYGYKFFEPVTVTKHIFDAEGNELGSIEYKSVVYKYDYKNDVAILANVSGVKFPEWIRISTAPVKSGDKVYAIGNPRMWYNTVSEGTVLKPKVFLEPGVPMIMFDAAIAPGSSGGGLFNDKGELIGITNKLMPGSVFGFANPIKYMVDLDV